jgi:hypothetical protein
LTKLTLIASLNNDSAEIDELLLQMADYKNDVADMAAERLFRKCSTSWQAQQYRRGRVHDLSTPDSARQQLRRIIKRIQVQIHLCRESAAVRMNSRERKQHV